MFMNRNLRFVLTLAIVQKIIKKIKVPRKDLNVEPLLP